MEPPRDQGGLPMALDGPLGGASVPLANGTGSSSKSPGTASKAGIKLRSAGGQSQGIPKLNSDSNLLTRSKSNLSVKSQTSDTSRLSNVSNVSKLSGFEAVGIDPISGAANEIQGRNIVLLAVYIGSFGYIGIESFGIRGEARNAIIDVAPTVVTPIYGYFMLFWLPVTIAMGIFIVFQLLPRFRASELIPTVAPFWGPLCLLQAFWAYELGQVSVTAPSVVVPLGAIFIAMALGLASLLSMDMNTPTFFEYWFIRAPFSLHASWLMCLAFLTLNMFAASPGVDVFGEDSELAIAICSIIMLFVLTVLFSVGTRRPDPIFPIPVFWTGVCIFIQSRDPEANRAFLLQRPQLAGQVNEGMGFVALQISMGCIWIVATSILLRTVVCCRVWERHNEVKQLQEMSQTQVMF